MERCGLQEELPLVTSLCDGDDVWCHPQAAMAIAGLLSDGLHAAVVHVIMSVRATQ